MIDDLWESRRPTFISLYMLEQKRRTQLNLKGVMHISTFVGSRLTRPQARAATPLQLRETATIPIESGPGYKTKPRTRINSLHALTCMFQTKQNDFTFIPIIWTQSTAVPVALDRNSARVSSAIARRLTYKRFRNFLNQKHEQSIEKVNQTKK